MGKSIFLFGPSGISIVLVRIEDCADVDCSIEVRLISLEAVKAVSEVTLQPLALLYFVSTEYLVVDTVGMLGIYAACLIAPSGVAALVACLDSQLMQHTVTGTIL